MTVEKKSGIWHLDQDHAVQLFDLPGIYSLSAQSPDERIAVDVLTGQVEGLSVPDLIIAVVDVQNLQRNLFLASQVADLEIPMVIALNCWDQAEKKGLQIDCALLASRLGVPVIPTVAHRHHGMEKLAAAALKALRDRPMMARPQWPTAVRAALDRLDREFNQQRGEGLRTGVLQRLLFDRDSPFKERLKPRVVNLNPYSRDSRNCIVLAIIPMPRNRLYAFAFSILYWRISWPDRRPSYHAVAQKALISCCCIAFGAWWSLSG